MILVIDTNILFSMIIALAIELDGEVWTGDKVLVEGLKEKGFDRFFKM